MFTTLTHKLFKSIRDLEMQFFLCSLGSVGVGHVDNTWETRESEGAEAPNMIWAFRVVIWGIAVVVLSRKVSREEKKQGRGPLPHSIPGSLFSTPPFKIPFASQSSAQISLPRITTLISMVLMYLFSEIQPVCSLSVIRDHCFLFWFIQGTVTFWRKGVRIVLPLFFITSNWHMRSHTKKDLHMSE